MFDVVLAVDAGELANSINAVWVLTVSFLIFFMQPGFLLLEAGQVRSKNVANVAMKNLFDWSLGILAFFIIGLGFAEAVSLLTAPGEPFSLGASFSYVTDPSAWIDWFFAAVFAMTAATIVSGAVAGRIRFKSYVLYSVLLTAVIYPVVLGLTWQGGLLSPDGYLGLLFGTGYLDFAGSTVVHMVGGLAGLTAASIIGPRVDRYDDEGSSQPVPGHSVLFAVLGTLFLAFGWFGFNVGTQATVLTESGEFMGEQLGRVALVTALGMSAGGVASSLVTIYYQGKPDPLFTTNGLLAGLVAITGAAPHITWWGGVLIGVVGGALVFPTFRFVVDTLKIDDVCGVFAVHGSAGAIGVLLLPLFAVTDGGGWALLSVHPGEFAAQMGMQITGVAVIGTWTVLATMTAFSALGLLFGLRSDETAQESGLDQAEHNVIAYPQFVTDGGTASRRPEIDDRTTPTDNETATMWRGQEVDDGPAEEQSQTVLDGAGIDQFPEPTLVVDVDDEITALNARAVRFFETTEAHTIGRAPSDLATAENDVLAATTDALQGGQEIREREGTITIAGEPIPVAVTATLVREDGSPVGAMATIRNRAREAAASRHRRTVEAYTDDALEHSTEKLSELAEGQLDVEPGVPEPPTDDEELLRLQEAFRALDSHIVDTAANITAIVEELPGQSEELADTSDTLSESSSEVQQSIRTVDSAASEIDERAADLSERTEDVRSNVQHLSASIEEITASTEQISAQSDEATERTQESVEAMVEVVKEIREAADETDAAVDEIEALREDIGSVAEITDIIQGIADQTNILALNAAVEAANADAGGSGFAVVADEVKSLAEETKDAAEEIEGIVDTAQEQTETVADRVETTNRRIVDGAAVVETTAEELETVNDRIAETNEGIAQISSTVEQQAENATQVSEAMQEIDERSEEISDRTTKISAMVTDEEAEMETVASLSERLNGLATEIHENIDRFDLQSELGAPSGR